MNIIGPKVRSIRESKHITQGLLAERCQELGWHISRGTLAKIEAQVRWVTDKDVVLLAETLKTSVQSLFRESCLPHCATREVITLSPTASV